MAQIPQSVTYINNNRGENVFALTLYGKNQDYIVFDPGTEDELTLTSPRDFSQDEIDAITRGLDYWSKAVGNYQNSASPSIIRMGIDTDTSFNAGAYGSPYIISPLQANIILGNDSLTIFSDVTGDSIPVFHSLIAINDCEFGFDPNTQLLENPRGLESVIIHEMGHALGITDDNEMFADLLVGEERSREFIGSNAIKVYSYDDDESAPRNIPMFHDSDQEDSHFGILNGLMTHQDFRNYATFTEVELASLQDLGYQIDRRDYFGLSIYTDGNYFNNVGGYFQSNGLDNDGDWMGYNEDEANTTRYGLGMHIYGSKNNVIQSSDILANGESAGGIRIDGFNNTVYIDSTVTANGKLGTGLLVAFGTGHNIIHRGKLEATGENGVAARFDFGAGFVDTTTGSYGSIVDGNGDTISLDGPLVNSFDITGTLKGSYAAILISRNAHVKEINIMGNAEITGDILSDYYQTDSLGKARTTALTFGKMANEYREATTDADDNFFYLQNESAILGSFDLEAWGGTTLLTSDYNVVSNVLVKSNAELGVFNSIGVDNSVRVEKDGLLSGAWDTDSSIIYASSLENKGTVQFFSVISVDSLANQGVLKDVNNIYSGFVYNEGDISSVETVMAEAGFINAGSLDIGERNTVDTMYVDGDFENSGVLHIDINANSYPNQPIAGVNNDLLETTNEEIAEGGTANFDGGQVNLVDAPDSYGNRGRFKSGDRFTFLTATNGVTVDDAPSVNESVPLFTFLFGTDAKTAFVDVERDYIYGPQGETYNQKEFGKYIDEAGSDPDPTGDLYPVLIALDDLNKGWPPRTVSDRALHALDEMSGSIYGSVCNASMNNRNLVNFTMFDLMRDRDRFGACANPCHCLHGLWAVGYGMSGNTQYDNNAYGYDQNFGGMIVGMDWQPNECANTGMYFSYTDASLKMDGLAERSDSQEVMFGGYARRETDHGYMLTQFGIGYNDYDTERNITFVDRKAESEHNAITGTFAAELGLDLIMMEKIKFQPYFGLQYIGMEMDDIHETGAGVLNLNADTTDAASFRSILGMRMDRSAKLENGAVLSGNFGVAWYHEFLSNTYTPFKAELSNPGGANFSSASTFTILGNDAGRDWAMGSFGLDYTKGRFQTFVGYNLMGNAQQVLHTGNAGVVLHW